MSEHDWNADSHIDVGGDTAQGEETPQQGQSASGAMVPSGDYLPERIYLLPIHNRPFFPAQVQPLIIQRQRWEETMQRVANTPHHMVGVAFIGDVSMEEMSPGSFPEIGTAVKVHRTQSEEHQIQFIAQGMRRFRIHRWLSKTPPYLVEVSYPREPVDAEAAKKRALTRCR